MQYPRLYLQCSTIVLLSVFTERRRLAPAVLIYYTYYCLSILSVISFLLILFDSCNNNRSLLYVYMLFVNVSEIVRGVATSPESDLIINIQQNYLKMIFELIDLRSLLSQITLVLYIYIFHVCMLY